MKERRILYKSLYETRKQNTKKYQNGTFLESIIYLFNKSDRFTISNRPAKLKESFRKVFGRHTKA